MNNKDCYFFIRYARFRSGPSASKSNSASSLDATEGDDILQNARNSRLLKVSLTNEKYSRMANSDAA